MKVTLLVRSAGGTVSESSFEADGEYTIGRSRDCACRVPDELVSKRHCALILDGGVVRVRDLYSVNGTTVDGINLRGDPEKEVTRAEEEPTRQMSADFHRLAVGQSRVQNGSVIEIGESKIEVRIDAAGG